jgi:multidrug efflux pump
VGRRSWSTAQAKRPSSDVASDLSATGAVGLHHHRPRHRGRFGITAATIDNALYDAFGQRIISTIFTQSNQYRVIMEADPALQTSLDSLNSIYVPSAAGGQVPLSRSPRSSPDRAAADQSSRPVPGNTISFNVPPGGSLGERGRGDPQPPSRRSACRDSIVTELPGRGARLPELALATSSS